VFRVIRVLSLPSFNWRLLGEVRYDTPWFIIGTRRFVVNPCLTQREGAIRVPDLQCCATHLNKELHARL
jgi:hypothetical protein